MNKAFLSIIQEEREEKQKGKEGSVVNWNQQSKREKKTILFMLKWVLATCRTLSIHQLR